MMTPPSCDGMRMPEKGGQMQCRQPNKQGWGGAVREVHCIVPSCSWPCASFALVEVKSVGVGGEGSQARPVVDLLPIRGS